MEIKLSDEATIRILLRALELMTIDFQNMQDTIWSEFGGENVYSDGQDYIDKAVSEIYGVTIVDG